MEKSNLLEAVFMALPAEHIMELAVKCRFYENVDEEDIEYTGGFDDQESIDGKMEALNPSHYFVAGMFKESVAREFGRLTLTRQEHQFVNAIGNHLCAYIANLKKDVDSWKSQWRRQVDADIELRENYKQLSKTYNDLHYEYKQLKKKEKEDEKKMDCPAPGVAQDGES